MAEIETDLKMVLKQLNALEDKLNHKVMQNSIAEAGRLVARTAKRLIPVGTKPHKDYKTGLTLAPSWARKNITVAKFKKKYADTALVAIGVKMTAFYAVNFVELGWRAGKRNKAVKRASRTTKGGLSGDQLSELGDARRKIAPQPWLLPAFNRNESKIRDSVAKSLAKQIKKISDKG